MASEPQKSFDLLGVSADATDSEIQRAYLYSALNCHPDIPNRDKDTVAKFEAYTTAYLSHTAESNTKVDGEEIFHNLIRDVLLSGKGDLGVYPLFAGLGNKPNTDEMYIENGDEESDTGEKEFEAFVEIIKNRKKKGKSTEGFTEEKLNELRETFYEQREEYRREILKKQEVTKSKQPTQVPVSKPKPKSKKQKAAEQRRREREMEAIADEIAEKQKIEEERAEKKKQAELEKQKRHEEERAKQAVEDKKRREK